MSASIPLIVTHRMRQQLRNLGHGEDDIRGMTPPDAWREILTAAALAYADRGWAVLPCNGEKRPRVDHGVYDATTDAEQIRDWWARWPDALIGVACGASGLFVVDCDVKGGVDGIEAFEELDIDCDGALPGETPSGGLHFLYQDPTGELGNTAGKLAPGIDTRGKGGYFIAPPSPGYIALDNWEERDPMPVPDALRALLQRPEPAPETTTLPIADNGGGESARPYAEAALTKETAKVASAVVGTRNSQLNTSAFALGQLVAAGALSRHEVESALFGASEQNGLVDDDGKKRTRASLESGLTKGMQKPRKIPAPTAPVPDPGTPPEAPPPPGQKSGKPKKLNLRDTAIKLALETDPDLFVNQYREPFARVPTGKAKQVLSLGEKSAADFREWLREQLFARGVTCSRTPLDDATATLRSVAKFRGPTYELKNRVAWGPQGALWYDLSDPQWRAIRITAAGWSLEAVPPIVFKRYTHQDAQVKPERVRLGDAHSTLEGVFRFVNLTGDGDAELLFTVYLVSLLIPDIAHPIPVLQGEHGSGKTFAFKTIKGLVDPSTLGALSIPWKPSEFVQQLDHHWVAMYDNLASLSDWQQDVICRAVTGEGNTKRKLYSDQDDIIFTYKRCLGLNGINVCSMRPDLLDRAILLEFDALSDRRETEADLLEEFEQVRPRLFGAMLSAMAGAMDQDVTQARAYGRRFRLADWAAWGWRIAEALGGHGQRFLKVYGTAVQDKAQQALEFHPLGQAVQYLMAGRDEWTGTPTELYQELEQTAQTSDIDTDAKGWPGSTAWLGRRLREVRPDLRAVGIHYEYDRDDARRAYILTRAGSQ